MVAGKSGMSGQRMTPGFDGGQVVWDIALLLRDELDEYHGCETDRFGVGIETVCPECFARWLVSKGVTIVKKQ